MSEPRWLDADAAARHLSIKRDDWRQLVVDGKFPGGIKRENRSGLWWDANAINEIMLASTSTGYTRNKTPDNLVIQPLEHLLGLAIPAPKLLTGIYFLLHDGAVVYVGQSIDIVARICQHRSNKKFDSWSWVECPREELNKTEFAYIKAFRPSLNFHQYGGDAQ